MPLPPWSGIHVSPSSSVKDERLVVPESCDTIVRLGEAPVLCSVTRIGSRLSAEVGALLSSQIDEGVDGHESLKETRKVVRYDWNMALPAFQLRPLLRQPASVPLPVASCASVGVKFW